jgi:hypothetical protein
VSDPSNIVVAVDVAVVVMVAEVVIVDTCVVVLAEDSVIVAVLVTVNRSCS